MHRERFNFCSRRFEWRAMCVVFLFKYKFVEYKFDHRSFFLYKTTEYFFYTMYTTLINFQTE